MGEVGRATPAANRGGASAGRGRVPAGARDGGTSVEFEREGGGGPSSNGRRAWRACDLVRVATEDRRTDGRRSRGVHREPLARTGGRRDRGEQTLPSSMCARTTSAFWKAPAVPRGMRSLGGPRQPPPPAGVGSRPPDHPLLLVGDPLGAERGNSQRDGIRGRRPPQRGDDGVEAGRTARRADTFRLSVYSSAWMSLQDESLQNVTRTVRRSRN